ncbi:hypothetical protein C8J55DRAFT_72550 [Lentinula edodes]|uniref:RRM domain-containing protein n=1 Tax=Lentinula lateritia TaxID=40482 RepID=A0A9W9DNZ5_9AGAR|nr:hypothetical protein C8J55DRAFT_72550 [Lentinula edodes]
MSEPVTKRLHISGLTPSLTPADLSARLSHFGTVKSVDGFGLLDGVGQPRKFGYVTMETTSGSLKKCLSTLSGTTYKGAKLRIGEAKPDFAERIIKEKEKESEHPIKKPRLRYSKFSGTQASDMSLVTRENASQRAGWKVMPSGRVVRTMKMRPGKPLPPLPTHMKDSKDGKKKKKMKIPDTRARSKTIDVTKWDGSYVTGVFLGGDEVLPIAQLREGLHGVVEGRVQDKEKEDRERKQKKKEKKEKKQQDKDREEKKKNVNILDEIVDVQALPDPLVPEPQSKPLPAPTVTTTTAPSHEDPSHSVDLLTEKAQTLSLLNSFLFSSSSSSKSKHDNIPVDWDSDVDLDEANVIEVRNPAKDVDEGYEIVPRVDENEMDVDVDQGPDNDEREDEEESDDSDSSDDTQEETPMQVEEKTQPPRPKINPLKDLFAPREDEGGFSLLNHLDLELDDNLDLDMVPFPTSMPAALDAQPLQPPASATISISRPVHQYHLTQPAQPITLDPSKPLFFPRSIALSASNASSSPFYHHQTPEEIQKRWEENKVELTRGWKKRYREAGKVRRRRGGGVED